MQLQLCSVFFTFSLGTRTHYFGRTILHGGAKVAKLFFICHWPNSSSILIAEYFLVVFSIGRQEEDSLCNILNLQKTIDFTLVAIL